jgi:hypothetical protein
MCRRALPAAVVPAGNDPAVGPDEDGIRGGPLLSSQTIWRWAILPFVALLWVGVLALAWRMWSTRKAKAPARAMQAKHDSPSPQRPSSGPQVPTSPVSQALTPSSPAAPPAEAQALASALKHGDLGEIARALCAAAGVKVGDLDAVRARLVDPLQRDALDTLQRARWGDGEAAATLQVLRSAFAPGIKWRAANAVRAPVLLPPLYPET